MPFANSQYMRFFPGFDVQVTLQWVQFNEILDQVVSSLWINTHILMLFANSQYMRFFPGFYQIKKQLTLAMQNNRAFSKGTTLYLVFPVKFIVILTMFILFSSSKATATLQMLTDK